jgi:hypothetical protein
VQHLRGCRKGKKGFTQIVAEKDADLRRFRLEGGLFEGGLEVPKGSIPQIECEPFLFEGFAMGVVPFDPADLGAKRFCSKDFQ